MTNFIEEFNLSNVEKNDAGNYVSKIVNYSDTISPLLLLTIITGLFRCS